MATHTSQNSSTERRLPPATTPEEREAQLINKALDLAERQLDEGTASAQLITHYVKAASSKEQLEREKLKMETELLGAKKEMMASAARIEELYTAAIQSMRAYAGQEPLQLEGSDADDEYYE